MSVEDYKLNAFVRSVLVRRWIDTSGIGFGTSNGVVYVKGALRRIYGTKRFEDAAEEDDLVSLIRRIEREIRSIQGVRDVVLKFDNFEKRAGQWRRKMNTLP
jgi:hypothetical protein